MPSHPIIPKPDLDRLRSEAGNAARSVATFAVFGGVLTGVTIGNADRINLVAGTALMLGILFALVGVSAGIDACRHAACRSWRRGYIRRQRGERAARSHAPHNAEGGK